MLSENVNALIDKILSVIQRKGETTAAGIKDSIAAFNQIKGGAEELRKILAELVSSGRVTIRTEKSRNGQHVEFYRPVKNHDNDSSNHDLDKGNNGISPRISVTTEIVFEGWDEIFALLPSLKNEDNSRNEPNTESFEVDAEDSDFCEVDDETGYDAEDSCPHEYDNATDYSHYGFNEVGYDEQWLITNSE